jgi:hypothetical protein
LQAPKFPEQAAKLAKLLLDRHALKHEERHRTP